MEKPGQQGDGGHGQSQDPQGLRQDAGAQDLHRRIAGQGRQGHAVFAPNQLDDAARDDRQANGQENQDQVVVGAGRPQAETLDDHGRQSHAGHGCEQAGNHGQTQGQQGGVHEHSAQGDEIHLHEIDDAHGVVDHAKAQGDEGVDRAIGQAAEDVLKKIGIQKCFQLLEMRRLGSVVEMRGNFKEGGLGAAGGIGGKGGETPLFGERRDICLFG